MLIFGLFSCSRFSISDNYILYEIMNNIIVNIAQLINPGIVGIARVAIRPV